jgi:hypothetical protein
MLRVIVNAPRVKVIVWGELKGGVANCTTSSVAAAAIASRRLQSASHAPSFVSAVLLTVKTSALAPAANKIKTKPDIVNAEEKKVRIEDISQSPFSDKSKIWCIMRLKTFFFNKHLNLEN